MVFVSVGVNEGEALGGEEILIGAASEGKGQE
jgi:hypothetical protein